MSLWKKPIYDEQLTRDGANTAVNHLGIELTEVEVLSMGPKNAYLCKISGAAFSCDNL